MNNVSLVCKCCLFYLKIYTWPGRDEVVNSHAVFCAFIARACKPTPLSQETIESQ